jgi:hypothetical protein
MRIFLIYINDYYTSDVGSKKQQTRRALLPGDKSYMHQPALASRFYCHAVPSHAAKGMLQNTRKSKRARKTNAATSSKRAIPLCSDGQVQGPKRRFWDV